MLIKYFLILLLSGSIACAKKSAEDEANAITAKLNAAPVKAQPIADTASQIQTNKGENKLKVIDKLTKVYNILKEKEDVRFAIFSPDRILHPNDKNDSIIQMREILQSLGYLKTISDSPFYDMELEEAVKAFQASHCIEPDGIIGEETKAKLNWSFGRRLSMLSETIEYLKKMVFTDKTILVNIPTYQLHCFEGEDEKLSMKVIVGQPRRQTPVMTSYINALTYYPTWTIPTKLFFEDKLPLIQKDEDYFENNNLEVFKMDGDEETEEEPDDIDWSEIDKHNFPYLIKQKPGKKNALGLIQYNLVNNEQIYLHDTPQKNLFKKFSRALSSGCVRLEKAVQLASWVLGKDKEKIKEELKKEETKTKELNKHISVQIAYLPVWVEDDGKVLWGDDPYKLKTDPKT